MEKRPNENPSNEAEPATKRERIEEAEEAQAGPSQPPPINEPEQAVQVPLRRSMRNKPSAFAPYSINVQQIMIGNFLKQFELPQQIQLRRVSPVWDGEVIHNCKLVKVVVLVLKRGDLVQNVTRESKYKLKYGLDKANWDKKENDNKFNESQIKVLSISEKHWNSDCIELIGRLFKQIEHLIIFDKSSTPEPDTDKYRALWSKLPNVLGLTLKVSNITPIISNDFLPRLFSAIEDNLAPLDHLSLRFNSNREFPIFALENIKKTMSYLRSFELNCSSMNLLKIYTMVGRNLGKRPTEAQRTVQALGIDVFLGREVIPLFLRNPELLKIESLSLHKLIHNIKMMSQMLEHLPGLKKLHLVAGAGNVVFCKKMFLEVVKMAHLEELNLQNFHIYDFTNLFMVERAHQIRRLTLNRHFVFESVLRKWRKNNDKLLDQNGQPRAVDQLYADEHVNTIFRPFVENLERLFPNLEEFSFGCNYALVGKVRIHRWCCQEFKRLVKFRLTHYHKY